MSRRGRECQEEGEGVKERESWRERESDKERERVSKRGKGCQNEGEGFKMRERASKRGRGGQREGERQSLFLFPFLSHKCLHNVQYIKAQYYFSTFVIYNSLFK